VPEFKYQKRISALGAHISISIFKNDVRAKRKQTNKPKQTDKQPNTLNEFIPYMCIYA